MTNMPFFSKSLTQHKQVRDIIIMNIRYYFDIFGPYWYASRQTKIIVEERVS
ncbi:MAG: hypothetical protein K6T83_15030 [Alicyclobacillus sp.]|nr:hypothetical protein [Alicyclobacillus sp.]